MSGQLVTLRFGGGSLTFADATGARRRVLGGQAFEVDNATAALLLQDPGVTKVELEAQVAVLMVAGPAEPEPMTVKELRARADQLGLTVRARATKAELEAAIMAEEASQTTAAADTPATDPVDAPADGATATDDGATVTTGAITLDDIPAGGVIGPTPPPDES